MAKVYFCPLEDGSPVSDLVKSTIKIYEKAQVNSHIEEGEYVAIKLHVGDENNTTFIPSDVAKALVDKVKQRKALPFLTETSTLYRGERENAVKHIMHAHRHGFSIEKVGAPFIMADGLAGDNEIEVKIEGELFNSVLVAREIRMTDFLIVLSHMTGHIAAGFGCAIKNLGMGLSSRKGKLRQHSSIQPEVIPDKCTLCKKCFLWCPTGAISEKNGKAFIDSKKCIGCGECLAVCRFGAIKFDWKRDSAWMQKAMAEHALGVVKDKKAFYINVLVNMTQDCDCLTKKQEKMIPDIGVLGSWDPVAVDKASLDLIEQRHGKDINQLSYPNINGKVQILHAEKIKLGTTKYELENVE